MILLRNLITEEKAQPYYMIKGIWTKEQVPVLINKLNNQRKYGAEFRLPTLIEFNKILDRYFGPHKVDVLLNPNWLLKASESDKNETPSTNVYRLAGTKDHPDLKNRAMIMLVLKPGL